LYNAHLEVVHASVGDVLTSAPSGSGGDGSSSNNNDDIPIEYTSFGGPAQNTVKSRAEQMVMQRRVRKINSFFSFFAQGV
jgi:peroxin-1